MALALTSCSTEPTPTNDSRHPVSTSSAQPGEAEARSPLTGLPITSQTAAGPSLPSRSRTRRVGVRSGGSAMLTWSWRSPSKAASLAWRPCISRSTPPCQPGPLHTDDRHRPGGAPGRPDRDIGHVMAGPACHRPCRCDHHHRAERCLHPRRRSGSLYDLFVDLAKVRKEHKPDPPTQSYLPFGDAETLKGRPVRSADITWLSAADAGHSYHDQEVAPVGSRRRRPMRRNLLVLRVRERMLNERDSAGTRSRRPSTTGGVAAPCSRKINLSGSAGPRPGPARRTSSLPAPERR